MKKESDIELERLAARTSVSFNHVILPFDLRDLVTCLDVLDYRMPGPLPPEPSSGPPSMTWGATGPVGHKGSFVADMNIEKQFIGVSGGDPSSNFNEVSDLVDLMEKEGMVSHERIRYYEFQGRYRIQTDRGLQSMLKSGDGSAIVKNGSRAFGKEMGLFTARLAAKDLETDSSDYFEIFIEPRITRPRSEIGISAVYRNSDSKAFGKFLSRFEERTLDFAMSLLKK